MQEHWKDIVDYEGIYEVSNQGRVRSSKDKTTKSQLHGTRKWKQRVLKQKVSKDGNHRVSLWKNKKESTKLVHRLVAESFLEKTPDKNYVNHIDGNRYNNCSDNLEWCDHIENNNHAFDNGLMPTNNFVVLEDLRTGDLIRFTSMVKASLFLERNQSYVSTLIKKGIYNVDSYIIYTTKAKNDVRVKDIEWRLKND